MATTLKPVGICLLGIVLSFILLSIFVTVDLVFAQGPDARARAVGTVWRFSWIYNPLTVLIVSGIVSILNRGKSSMLISLLSVLPFLTFDLLAGSFTQTALLFSLAYITIAIAVSILARSLDTRRHEIK